MRYASIQFHSEMHRMIRRSIAELHNISGSGQQTKISNDCFWQPPVANQLMTFEFSMALCLGQLLLWQRQSEQRERERRMPIVFPFGMFSLFFFVFLSPRSMVAVAERNFAKAFSPSETLIYYCAQFTRLSFGAGAGLCERIRRDNKLCRVTHQIRCEQWTSPKIVVYTIQKSSQHLVRH